MRLIVVRHGQTACNIENVWHGWDDCELTQTGLAQADAVADRLADEEIDAVYSSDSRRAFQTAQAIASRHGLTPMVDPALRERNAGEYEGIPVGDVEAVRPTIWEERAADYWGWSPPSGETFAAVWERLRGVIERLQKRHEGQTVVAVTHMSPMRILISRLADLPIERTYDMEFPSTGISIFSLHEDGALVETLNDATHVDS
jgi:broad specificity phosphatase PhoE